MKIQILTFLKNLEPVEIEIFKFPVLYLKVVGIWIENDSSKMYKFFAYFMQFLFLHLWLILIGVSIFQKTNLNEIVELVIFFFTYLACTFKCINLIFNIENFIKLITDLRKAIEDLKVPTMYIKKQLKIGKILFMMFWFPILSSTFIGICFIFFSNETILPIWLPYDPQKSLFFSYFTVFYQIINCLFYSNANVMMDIVSFIPMLYLIAILEHLCDKLENLKNFSLINPNESMKIDNYEELLNYVNHQRTIVELIKRFEKIFAKVFAIQGSFMAIILCTVAFVLTLLSFDDDFGPIMQFSNFGLSMAFQLAIPCYYCEVISSTYDKISYSAFYSDWFYEDQKYRKDFKFFMQNATRKIKLSAFGLYDINLETFVKVVNMAYSFYAVCKRVDK
ncbi:hypothetical protein PVAND_012423 [Polypedilum vanderplanki]|uniref:Odorant receptor n=1 Tax=Polypedilum vanderplanki TaxID=319348 RepID=A0A9J6CNC6_POLVA|nr:hypothetical protein PVAND_012423 [Polypedilum vanderplanki]